MSPRPSSETGVMWIHARGARIPRAASRGGCGKWLCFVSRPDVDEAWDKILHALVDGRLGHAAKVSTAMPNPLAKRGKSHVICVYTDDADDEADVVRVREVLRELGFDQPIPYKTDAATEAGEYKAHGDKNISKYFM